MSDQYSREADEQRAHHAPDLVAADPVGARDDSTAAPTTLLSTRPLSGRGNSAVRAALVQRVQQTHGNRAAGRILQRVAAAASAPAEDDIATRIQNRAGGGASLDPGVQRQLEGGLGADLSGVRVHTDSEADHLSRSVDAVAFTTGSDIFFRSGAYEPESASGLRLLAHEATHTVQQAAGPVAGTPAPGGVSVSDPSDSFEQAAEHTAEAVVAGGTAPPSGATAAGSGVSAQREAAPEEEEPVQTMRAALQREAAPEEEELPAQTMRASVQREAAPEEEELPAQTMRASLQREAAVEEELA
jgi:hypothetical protein